MTDAAPSARSLLAMMAEDVTDLPDPPGARPHRRDGPLGWQGYDAVRARARERTGEVESVVCATGRAGGTEAVLLAFEFSFLGGSIGERAGDRIVSAFTWARELSLPVVSVIATGGSRMQEGIRALVQLQRIAQHQVLLRATGLPHLAVLAGPATGGGWATLGAGADVRLALPGVQVGFAGSRVRPPDADPDAYTAQAQWASGHVDALVPHEALPAAVGRWLRLLTGPATGPPPPPPALGSAELPRTGWQAVRQARHPDRPRADRYLAAYFDDRVALSSGDPGLWCGLGSRPGGAVAYVAQLGTATLPAGYRAAARLVRLADRLGMPVLTLVDTPGAAGDPEAERDGIGAALAETFSAVAACRTPVTTLVVGQGGSGGALALTAPGRTWVTPDSYYAVIAPELAAAVLKRDADQVPATAEHLRLRPQDLVDLGVAREVVGPAS